MRKKKIKNFLDFIPLFILTTYAIILIWTVSTSDITLFWKHIVGLVLLPINYVLFFWRHKVGVLALGLTLLLGLASILSYSPEVSTTTLYKNIGDKEIPFFYGQLIFFFWIVIHFILSGRHYVGIATKKYWRGLANNSDVAFD
jgi:hypothetical protein